MARQSKFSHKTRAARWYSRNARRRARARSVHAKYVQERTSTLSAEEYRVKYLVGGNQWLSRLLRWNRMKRNNQ